MTIFCIVWSEIKQKVAKTLNPLFHALTGMDNAGFFMGKIKWQK